GTHRGSDAGSKADEQQGDSAITLLSRMGCIAAVPRRGSQNGGGLPGSSGVVALGLCTDLPGAYGGPGKEKGRCRLGTLNIRGKLNDRLPALESVMIAHELDALVITETKGTFRRTHCNHSGRRAAESGNVSYILVACASMSAPTSLFRPLISEFILLGF